VSIDYLLGNSTAKDIHTSNQAEQFLIEVGDDPLDAPKSQEQAQADGAFHHIVP